MPVEKNINLNHVTSLQKLYLENRENLTVSGVENVDSFTDTEVVLLTNSGKLTVKGTNLHINKLNVETGDFSLKGYVTGLTYSKASPSVKGNMLERLFR